MTKDNQRTTIATTLMVISSALLYAFVPFIWVYGFFVVASVILMIHDSWISTDGKAGMITYILKFTTLIPVVNAVPFMLIPIFSVVNKFYNEDEL